MILTLTGLDVGHLVLGLVNDQHQEITPPQTIPCRSEEYLALIDGFLTAHDLTLAEVTGIVVASGDGSATAMRVTHAIANALGFARGIPLYRSLDSAPMQILLPEYEAEVQITKRKKDILNRKA